MAAAITDRDCGCWCLSRNCSYSDQTPQRVYYWHGVVITIVSPTVATEKPGSSGNNALFELNSGSFIQNLTLTGMQAGNSGTNTLDSVLPAQQGWNFAFYDDAFIT